MSRYKLQAQPLCELCLRAGKIEPAALVNHIVALEDGGELHRDRPQHLVTDSVILYPWASRCLGSPSCRTVYRHSLLGGAWAAVALAIVIVSGIAAKLTETEERGQRDASARRSNGQKKSRTLQLFFRSAHRRGPLAAMCAASRGPQNAPFLSRSVREVEPKVTRSPIDVHAAFPKNVATNQNVIGREVIEHGKVTDKLNPILEPN